MVPTKVKGRLHAVMSLFVTGSVGTLLPELLQLFWVVCGEEFFVFAIITMVLVKVIKGGGGCPCAACL